MAVWTSGKMGNEGPRRALLLGLLEVRQPLEQLDDEGRERMFDLCHTASVAGHVDNTDWLGWQERGLMGVEVVLDQGRLHVTNNEDLVSQHNLNELDAVVVVQGTEGHLIIIGHCQVKNLPLAVVLDMMSQVDACQLQKDIQHRLSRLLPPSVQSSELENTKSPTLPTAPSLMELSSIDPPVLPVRTVSQHPDQASAHTSAPHGPTRTQPAATVVLPSSCSAGLPRASPLPVRNITPVAHHAKPKVANMSPSTTRLATPLRCAFIPPVSRVAVSPESTHSVANPLRCATPESTRPVPTPRMSAQPVFSGSVSTPLVFLRPVSGRSVSTRTVSSPSLFSHLVSNPAPVPRPVSTSLASSSPVSTSTVSTSAVSSLPVSHSPFSSQHASALSVPTPLVSTPPLSSQLVSTTLDPTPAVSTRPLSKPALPTKPVSTLTAPSRPVSLSRPSTQPLLITSVSIPTASSSSVSTPRAPTRPISSSRVATPLVFTPIVSTTPDLTRPTVTRPVSKPTVSTRPVPFPKMQPSPVFTEPVAAAAVPTTSVSMCTTMASITMMSSTSVTTTPVFDTAPSTLSSCMISVSTTPASITVVSNASVFTAPVITSAPSATPFSVTSVCSTPVATTVLSSAPVSTSSESDQSSSTVMVSSSLVSTPLSTAVSASNLSSSSSSVSTVPSTPEENRRHSGTSFGSQEDENSSGNGKIELILGTLNVNDSANMFLYGLSNSREQDSSSSLEHELSSFLENERQYLDLLQRIIEARKVVKSELQNLLRLNESLACLHENLFQDLQQEFPSCLGVARAFLYRREELEQYCYCLMNAPKVLPQLVKQTEEVKRQHPMLEADLKSCWKRLHFYFMTFDKLSKIAPVEEQSLVQQVVDMLRDMNRQGDSAILIDSISGAPFNLHTLGSLLLHDLFTIKDSSGILKTKVKHHVLLFEEMIVITLPKKECQQFKDQLPIRQLNIRQQNSDDRTFVLDFLQGGSKKNRILTFKSKQMEAKDAWEREISRLHMEYANEVKRHSKLRYGWI